MIDLSLTSDEIISFSGAFGPLVILYVGHLIYRSQQRWFHRKKTPFVGQYAPPMRVLSADKKKALKMRATGVR